MKRSLAVGVFSAIVLASCGPPARNGGGDDATPPLDAPACAVCSEDLHDVLACDGTTVVSHCPADQGCANGACVPACDAALASASTFGCDYFTYEIDDAQSRGGCYAAFIANTWDTPVSVGLDRGGVPHTNLEDFARIPTGTGTALTYAPLPGGKIPPGEVAILFLDGTGTGTCSFTSSCGCPAGVTPVARSGGIKDTAMSVAYHISTSAPVVAYDIFPYGGGGAAVTSASLLLPTSAWKQGYVGVQPWAGSDVFGHPTLGVIAQADSTDVTITPTTNIIDGVAVNGTPEGVPHTYHLDRGNVLQVAADNGRDLSGTTVSATNPIAVWGSLPCSDLGAPACDSMHQQTPPVDTLGHEYAAVRYRNRVDGHDESVPWKLVGAADGTMLTYEPAAPPGAPTTLRAGQSVTFHAPGPFVVRSQDASHAFYVGAFMTGCGDPIVGDYLGTEGCAGDPEAVNVVPPEEYLKRYVFFTDPTYPETNLVIVRVKSMTGEFRPVHLDCLGDVTGWEPIGTSGTYELARVDLVRHNFEPQGSCDNGRHEMTSDAPFGVTVWGWGTKETGTNYANYPNLRCPNGTLDFPCFGTFTQAVSYAYPAGMYLRAINPIE
jgi:IgGFc binding protein